MKRKLSLPIVLGICLILCSLLLLLLFRVRMQAGYRSSQRTAAALSEMLPERTPGTPGIDPGYDMPVWELEGTDYVALLEIPSFGITLPVANQWDNAALTQAPARFSGSVYDNTLVIGGVDDPKQFGFCDKIEHSAYVTVTDMTGAEFTYRVRGVSRAKHADAQWLAREDCDLTLFCHDTYSMEYIAVRCVFA